MALAGKSLQPPPSAPYSGRCGSRGRCPECASPPIAHGFSSRYIFRSRARDARAYATMRSQERLQAMSRAKRCAILHLSRFEMRVFTRVSLAQRGDTRRFDAEAEERRVAERAPFFLSRVRHWPSRAQPDAASGRYGHARYALRLMRPFALCKSLSREDDA